VQAIGVIGTARQTQRVMRPWRLSLLQLLK